MCAEYNHNCFSTLNITPDHLFIVCFPSASSTIKKVIGYKFFTTGCHMHGIQYQIVLNIILHPEINGTQITFIIATQNIQIYILQTALSRLLRHTWVKVVMLFYPHTTGTTRDVL